MQVRNSDQEYHTESEADIVSYEDMQLHDHRVDNGLMSTGLPQEFQVYVDVFIYQVEEKLCSVMQVRNSDQE